MLLPQDEDPTRSLRRLVAHLSDTPEKEREPSLPISAVAHGLQAVVILLAVLLEEVRQVEHRLVQRPVFGEEECDQQSPDAAVPVEERVDCLELRMRETDLHQERQIIGSMEKRLEVAECAR